eukprot:TRINITY_DN16750_c2_g2_i1.p1 TRINITY_DN16750_c2_g2~~TRINITY_DN16750_c2_g2_i1.p1  ORF type:complete len:196 (+),score=43.38 TRINITY_DN16750_c2_g2_i1:28-588(+)
MAETYASPATVEYWDEFYDDRRSTYDTLYGYEDFRPVLLEFLRSQKVKDRGNLRLLHAGCGTSNMTEGLWKDGLRKILNIDFSQVVIDLMAERWEDRAACTRSDEDSAAMRRDLQWRRMDLTDLSELSSGDFDLALEKFTLDAMLCESKDDAFDPRGNAAVRELHRVLKPGGTFLSIAWGAKRRKA